MNTTLEPQQNTKTTETGAMDLSSIIVGVIILGIVGGIVGAALLALIPWSQDQKAQAQLKAVATAETAYAALTIEDQEPRRYGSTSELYNAGVFDNRKDTPQGVVIISTEGTGAEARYAVGTRSETGQWFYLHNYGEEPQKAGSPYSETYSSISFEFHPNNTVSATVTN